MGIMITKDLQKRRSGILLHPTSLPSEYGIGDLGPELYKFIDYLNKWGQTIWQILPLGHTGYGNSPYQCFSAFAGNPLLISPQILVQMSLLTKRDLIPPKITDESRIDYKSIIAYKKKVIENAYRIFALNDNPELTAAFQEFIDTQSYWLNDYSIFMSLKNANGMKSWIDWDEDLKTRNSSSISKWVKTREEDLNLHKFSQFLFFNQWLKVKKYANQRNVKIIGDIPIFVAYDSVDVWSNPDSYFLNEDGNNTINIVVDFTDRDNSTVDAYKCLL